MTSLYDFNGLDDFFVKNNLTKKRLEELCTMISQSYDSSNLKVQFLDFLVFHFDRECKFINKHTENKWYIIYLVSKFVLLPKNKKSVYFKLIDKVDDINIEYFNFETHNEKFILVSDNIFDIMTDLKVDEFMYVDIDNFGQCVDKEHIDSKIEETESCSFGLLFSLINDIKIFLNNIYYIEFIYNLTYYLTRFEKIEYNEKCLRTAFRKRFHIACELINSKVKKDFYKKPIPNKIKKINKLLNTFSFDSQELDDFNLTKFSKLMYYKENEKIENKFYDEFEKVKIYKTLYDIQKNMITFNSETIDKELWVEFCDFYMRIMSVLPYSEHNIKKIYEFMFTE